MTNKHLLFLPLSFFSFSLFAQPINIHKSRGGIISLGVRSTISAFNDGDWSSKGTGAGGQLRVGISNRLNTDWYADYITGNIGGFAHRKDCHIGWSVMYYFIENELKQPKIQPYMVVGHCFDYSKQTDNKNKNNFAERWSSAIQCGLGTHFNLTDRFDVSVVTQYMMHLGTDIHAEHREPYTFYDPSWEGDDVHFVKEKGVNLEGHLLINVSLNYKIFDAW